MESISKKSRKVIEENLEVLRGRHPLIEEELCMLLGRDYYERNRQAGSRNGSKRRAVNVGVGDIEIAMPQVRGSERPFHSKILPPYIRQMDEIKEVVPLLYMNGISTRKVKGSIKKLLKDKGFSHQNVLRLTERIVEEFRGWRRRDLSGLKVLYLILDGIWLGVRAGTREKEAVLVARAFLEDGNAELISVSLGNQESYSAWKGFLEDMIKRGLNDPLLIVIDGCPGLIRAVEELFPGSDIQRCTKHRTENVLNKVLKEDRAVVKESIRKIFYASTYEHAKEAIEIFKRDWGRKYPSASECLKEYIEACLTYYKYPYRHWRRIRTTNAVERSFREVRGRVRGIGRFKDEERALTMVYWQIKELRWHGVDMTAEARAVLAKIKTEKLGRIAA
ncbi:MAG: IS256 family transposase [Nitrospirae bacterium]|nr:IS256 family transposase [Nitrospirota bacterium]